MANSFIWAYFLGLFMLTACVAQEELILPTKYQRVAAANAYKNCVASATNSRFDNNTKPDVIVKNSMGACSHFKYNMLKEYPKRWRENYLKDVDAQLFKREVEWIVQTRKKGNSFFR